MYTEEKLKELQTLSLEDKIALSKLRITEFLVHRVTIASKRSNKLSKLLRKVGIDD